MKEWWSYAKASFANPEAVHRAVRKARRVDEYRAAVDKIFGNEQLVAPGRSFTA